MMGLEMFSSWLYSPPLPPTAVTPSTISRWCIYLLWVFSSSSIAWGTGHCQRQETGLDGPQVWSCMAILVFPITSPQSAIPISHQMGCHLKERVWGHEESFLKPKRRWKASLACILSRGFAWLLALWMRYMCSMYSVIRWRKLSGSLKTIGIVILDSS